VRDRIREGEPHAKNSSVALLPHASYVPDSTAWTINESRNRSVANETELESVDEIGEQRRVVEYAFARLQDGLR
jgi:hypothetical protein